MAHDLSDANADAAAVAAATSHAVAAIEIVDSRIADWRISFADTVADNGSSAFFVLGSEHRPLAELDLYTCGAACLRRPPEAAAWLPRTLGAAGDPLRAGDVVLTGALGPMVEVTPGDRIEAKIGGLGSVSFSYEENRT